MYPLEIHHLAIIGEMFVLSLAALAVYWRYIRENIPLDFHHPSNRDILHNSSADFDSPDMNHTEDGNNNDCYIVDQSGDYLHNSPVSDPMGNSHSYGTTLEHDSGFSASSSGSYSNSCVVHI